MAAVVTIKNVALDPAEAVTVMGVIAHNPALESQERRVVNTDQNKNRESGDSFLHNLTDKKNVAVSNNRTIHSFHFDMTVNNHCGSFVTMEYTSII